MSKVTLLLDALDPELFPPSVAAAAAEISCEFDLPVTYVKAFRVHDGGRKTVHLFQGNELQLFPEKALRRADRAAITEAAQRLSLVWMIH